MKAKDKNNKTLKEADWISYNNRIYQIDSIIKGFESGITAVLWVRYIKLNKKIKILKEPLYFNPFVLTKIDPPLAYNITDNE